MSDLKLLQTQLRHALKQGADLEFANRLLKKFPQAKIYLVGGIVRDWLLKRDSQDYDFVVSGVPVKKLESFLKTQGQVNLVGRRFGVFKFTPKKSTLTLDIALPRTEHAWGTGGYKDVETQSDWRLPIEEDLKRRDFTINAMALEMSEKKLIDPFNGQIDLKKKLIKTVGKSEERFKEDYSRMLRALRFSAQLNFKIEKNTWVSLVKMMKKISNGVVPAEVISKEFIKSLMSDPVKTLDMWNDSNAFKYLMPELLKMRKCPQPKEFHAEGDVWTHTRLALRNLTTPAYKKFIKTLPEHIKKEPALSPELILGVLFHDLGKPYTIKTPAKDGVDRIRTDGHDTFGAKLTKKIGERLRFNSVPNQPCDLDKISWIIVHHMLIVHGEPAKFTNRTIEKYFFNPKNPGGNLLKLIYADQMASFVKGQPSLGSLPQLIKRIKQLPKKLRQKNTLPPPLLDGNEIMKILKIKPSPQVGVMIEKLREAQLAGRIKNKIEAKKMTHGVIPNLPACPVGRFRDLAV